MQTIHEETHSLRSRIGQRVDSAKRMLDIGSRIAQRPWPAVGIAIAFGALAGLASRPFAHDAEERSIRAAITAGIGALAIRLIKSYALGELADVARSWIDDARTPSRVQTQH